MTVTVTAFDGRGLPPDWAPLAKPAPASGARADLAARAAAAFASRARAVCALLALCALAVLAGCSDSRGSRGSAAATEQGAAAVAVAVARGNVEVPGGLVDIGAPVDGVVDTVSVQDGDRVEAGQVLLQLASEAQRQELAMAEAELRLAEVRQQAQQARLPAAADLARRTAEAAQAGAIDAQLAADAERGRQEVQAGVAIARAETAVAQQKVRQARNQAARLTVRAMTAGSVVRLLAQPGARVAAASGKPLLTLLPARPLRVRAELNEAFLSRVVVGMRARVVLDGEAADAQPPAGLPEAKVVRLSPLFANSRLDDEAQPRGRTRVVDCFLEFDRAPPLLRVGQAVRVEFHE